MIKNRKFFMCFSINTTHSGRETSNFACDKYLTIFAMEKEKSRMVDVSCRNRRSDSPVGSKYLYNTHNK